jgi:tripartite-type tricarboxylate transporter receptor subunit TctC
MCASRRLRALSSVAAGFACLQAVSAMGAAAAAAAAADGYPSRPVRLVVPYPAGTGTDTIARVIGQRLAERMGASFVIDNRPGGASIIGIDLVAKALPDGYTVLVGAPSLTISPALQASIPFDVVRDFAPVIRVTSAPLVMVVAPQIGTATLKEFLALARAKPGQLNFASGGIGGSIHMGMELLNSMAKIKVVHVPYKGSPQALVDLLSGQVHAMTNIVSSSLPHVAQGRLVALGVTGSTRIAVLPHVPTVSEAGVPGYELMQWHGLLVPAKTPAAVIRRLESETREVMKVAAVRESLASQGFEPVAEGPVPFAAMLKEELVKWSRVVRDSGARAH